MRSAWYMANMGKKRNLYRVLVGIAEEWRLPVLVRCGCNGDCRYL